MTKLFGNVYAVCLDVLETSGPVDLGLARAEQVEIGAIE
jgi:hypothetical protein